MIYDKSCPEYVENGLYQVGDVLWYSIWTFKNKFGGLNNTGPINLADAINLSKLYDFITLVPEIGNFETVRGFREKDLKEFYKI